MPTTNKHQAIKKAREIYKEIAADDRRLAEGFLSICAAPSEYKISRKTKRK